MDFVEFRVPTAAECFELGNTQFAQHRYEAATQWYTRAIDVDAGARDVYLYFASRSACLEHMGLHSQSAVDARSCVALEPCTTGYIRLAATVLHMLTMLRRGGSVTNTPKLIRLSTAILGLLTPRASDASDHHQLFIEARGSLVHAHALIKSGPIPFNQVQLSEIGEKKAKLNQLVDEYFAELQLWPGKLVTDTLRHAGISGKDFERVQRLVDSKAGSDTLMTSALRLVSGELTAPVLADMLLSLHIPTSVGGVDTLWDDLTSSGAVGVFDSADDQLQKLIETAEGFGMARVDRSQFNNRAQLIARAKEATVKLRKESERMLVVGAKSLVTQALVATGICGGFVIDGKKEIEEKKLLAAEKKAEKKARQTAAGAMPTHIRPAMHMRRIRMQEAVLKQEADSADETVAGKGMFSISARGLVGKIQTVADAVEQRFAMEDLFKKAPPAPKAHKKAQKEAEEQLLRKQVAKADAEEKTKEAEEAAFQRTKITDVSRVFLQISSIQDRAAWNSKKHETSKAAQLVRAVIPLIRNGGGELTKPLLIDLLSALGFPEPEALRMLRRGASALATQTLVEAGFSDEDRIEVVAMGIVVLEPGKNAKERQQKTHVLDVLLDTSMALVRGEVTEATLVSVLEALGMPNKKAKRMLLGHEFPAPLVSRAVLVAPRSPSVAEDTSLLLLTGLESWAAAASAHGAKAKLSAQHSATEAELVALVASTGGPALDFIIRSMPFPNIDSPLPLRGRNAGLSFLQLVVRCGSHTLQGNEDRGPLERHDQQLAVLLDWWLGRLCRPPAGCGIAQSRQLKDELPTSGVAAVAHAVRLQMPAVLQVCDRIACAGRVLTAF
jgi:hypothetical protein